MNKTQRVIITGGPGTGKSTLIDSFSNMGYPCHHEISRAVIKRELDKGSDLQPWKDLEGFSKVVFTEQIEQYNLATKAVTNFYDRSLIDVIAYLRLDGINTQDWDVKAKQYTFFNKVFVTPPWPEIYATDNERREDLAAMREIHESLVKTYQSFGYEIIEVAKMSNPKRVKFILGELN